MAEPRTLSGSTSGSMTQTTGPQVAAKETMKPPRQASVTMASGSPAELGSAISRLDSPSTVRLVTIPARPASSSGLRPTRSTIRTATTVAATLSTPMTRLA